MTVGTATDFTFGVEEEFQLVDMETGALRSRAIDVVGRDWTERVEGELQLSTVETGTAVCANAAELDAQLRELRLDAAVAAGAEDLDIVAAGLHPFSRWEGQDTAPAERPLMLLDRFRRLVRDKHIFGMHIHVGVPDPFDRITVLDRVRVYMPHVLALSCSSSFFEGEDTGYASFRTIIAQRMPFSGAPPHFASAREYADFVSYLQRADAIPDERTLYWSVRPSARYPTVEIRAPDACPTIDDAVGIAALVRALVRRAAVTPEKKRRRFSPFSASLDDVLLDTNEWRVARYGLDATLLDPSAREEAVVARVAVRRLLRELRPFAEEGGDADALDHVRTILRRGNASDRMRSLARSGHSIGDIMDWLQGETRLGVGLDRRHAQRT